MKATELIAHLQKIVDEKGDLSVYLSHGPAASRLEKTTWIEEIGNYKMILEGYRGAGILLD